MRSGRTVLSVRSYHQRKSWVKWFAPGWDIKCLMMMNITSARVLTLSQEPWAYVINVLVANARSRAPRTLYHRPMRMRLRLWR